jgi:hypothetical protein
LKEAEEKHLQADEKYLELLGLVGKPSEDWQNVSTPTIVTYAFDKHCFQVIGLIRNTAYKLPNHTLLIYDLGLSKHSLNKVRLQVIYHFSTSYS